MDLEKELLSQTPGAGHYESYDDIKRGFNEWGSGDLCVPYNISLTLDTYHAHKIIANMLLRHASSDSKHIIDFCCGAGLSGELYSSKGYVVDGVDFSREMIKRIKPGTYRYVWEKDVVNDDLSFIKGYDIALCIGAIGEFIPSTFLIPKIAQSLNQKGVMGISVLIDPKVEDNKAFETLKLIGFEVCDNKIGIGYDSEQTGQATYHHIVAKR